MDFHELPRRDLQALCKRNGIRANMTNVAMADALAALPAVDGIEEEKKAAAVQAAAAEEEEGDGEGDMQGISLPGGRGVALTPHEVIILDDSEENDKDLTLVLGVGRRRATRRARVEPVAAPATRKRAATAEALPARNTRARSQRTVVSAPEEEAPKAIRTPRRAVARKTSTKQEEEEKGTQGDVSDDCVVDSSVEERQVDVQQFEDSPIIQNDTVSSEEIHPASVATVDEGVMEVVTVDNLSQATVTDDEGVVKKSGFTADLTHVSIEEDAAVAADEMPLNLNESVKEEAVPVENLSQATLTDDEGAVKGSGFSCDLADVSVEEDDGVFAADGMSQRSATLEESAKEEVATVENLSQATVTDDEWVVKENAFAGDLPPVVVTARGFSDHITSRLSAGMRETATKSMSINSITEPVAVEQEKERKEGKECEALGSLSLRKLRIQLKEKVAVPQENEVKEGKESKALDMLSLRKLKMKLKETLNAQKENR